MQPALVPPAPSLPAPPEPPPARPGPRFPLLVLLWTGVGAAFLAQYVAVYTSEGLPVRWSEAVWAFLGWYVWVPLTPLVVRIARRYPITGEASGRRVALHVLLGAVISVAEVTFYTLVRWALDAAFLNAAFDPGGFFHSTLLRSVFFDILVYAVIVAVVHALDGARASRAREVDMVRLERQLSEAQLAALRMQLNPHFLFNTLQTISAILERDAAGARRLMSDLSGLLRTSLDRAARPFVTLRQEETFVRRYLAIEQERLADRLRVDFDVDDAAREALVPHLLLQPLVENAVRHGIAPYARHGRVRVAARVDGDVLDLRVEDDGPGHDPAAPPRHRVSGIGLRTTRERLDRHYGDEAALVSGNRPEGGFAVHVRLPYVTDVLDAEPEGVAEAAA